MARLNATGGYHRDLHRSDPHRGVARALERAVLSRNKSIDATVIPTQRNQPEETNMDKDRIKGSADQAKGAVKEGVGKVLGDKKLETEGKADKAAGKVRNAVGGLKDAVRDN